MFMGSKNRRARREAREIGETNFPFEKGFLENIARINSAQGA